MLAPGFEWFVAWRHLRDPERRSRWLLRLGIVLVVLAGIAWVALDYAISHRKGAIHGPSAWGTQAFQMTRMLNDAKTVTVVVLVVGGLLLLAGALRATFTVFTAISIGGVFLGTGAPIIALSVMSGFEADLKTKIRATKADVVVSVKDEAPFTGWEAVQEQVASVPGVVASMAYIESEVIIKHATNP